MPEMAPSWLQIIPARRYKDSSASSSQRTLRTILLKTNSTLAWLSSTKTTISSKLKMLRTKDLTLNWTNSLIWAPMNTLSCLVSKTLPLKTILLIKLMKIQMANFNLDLELLPLLIGELRMQLLLLRTKVLVELAILSLPQLQWKESTPLSTANYKICRPNN